MNSEKDKSIQNWVIVTIIACIIVGGAIWFFARSNSTTNSSSANTDSVDNAEVDSVDYDCSDFSTHDEAQEYFDSQGGNSSNNVDRLDSDHDGIACELLQ